MNKKSNKFSSYDPLNLPKTIGKTPFCSEKVSCKQQMILNRKLNQFYGNDPVNLPKTISETLFVILSLSIYFSPTGFLFIINDCQHNNLKNQDKPKPKPQDTSSAKQVHILVIWGRNGVVEVVYSWIEIF